MIASTLEAIDPCVDATRNEGEARLRLLSSALRSGWAGRSPAPRDELVEELLQICEGPVEQVRICLDAATTQSFSPATADEMKPADRQLAVALVGSDRLAVLHWPQELLPAPRIVVEVKQSLVEVRRSSCNTKLVISRRGGRGGRGRGSAPPNTPLADLGEAQVSLDAGDRLFAPIVASSGLGGAESRPLGDMPRGHAQLLAEFWRDDVRANCAVEVATPGAGRPLVVETTTVRREAHRNGERVVLSATLHGSSVACLCTMHGHGGGPSATGRRPNGRENTNVCLHIAMCGRRLAGATPQPLDLAAGQVPRNCHVHGAAAPDVPSLPTLCCAHTSAWISCDHSSQNNRQSRKTFLSVPLAGSTLFRARALLTSASILSKRAAKRKLDGAFVERDERELRAKLASVDTEFTAGEMAELDAHAVRALLDKKNVRRKIQHASKKEVLVEDIGDGYKKLTKKSFKKSGVHPSLTNHHRWLFLPLARR